MSVSNGAANQLMVVGAAIYSLGASRHDLTLMPLNTMTVGVDKTNDEARLSKQSEPSIVRVLMSLIFLT